MPVSAPSPCRYVGCRKLVRSGFCDDHGASRQHAKKVYDKARGSSTQRGYNYRWQKSRLVFLDEHPLCVYCQREGRVVVATVVDHVIPHKGDQSIFWDRDNWQSLCKQCHDRKTATQDSRFAAGGGS